LVGGEIGRDPEQDREHLPADHQRPHRVERDDQLAPVELDGPGGELNHVDKARDLFELTARAVPKRRDGTEAVEVSGVCHAPTVRKSCPRDIGRPASSLLQLEWEQGTRPRSDARFRAHP